MNESNDEETKYHISAFFNTNKELADAARLVNDWNSYLDGKRKLANA